jgi:hypothetical protein
VKRSLLSMMVFVGLFALAQSALAQEEKGKTPEKQPVKIGVYDSRCVAFAHFWTEAGQKKIQQLMADAKKAKESGDKKQMEELEKQGKEGQQKIHRQVFSTAPIDEILDEIKDRLPEIQKKAGVSVLISKWDEEKLKQYPSAEKIDVTDPLVELFKLDEKQQKVLESIKKAKPVSVEEADRCK